MSKNRWWWLSFTDPNRPEGEQFLGGAFVKGRDGPDAIKNAWALGCNPGGEVFFAMCPWSPPSRFRARLMTREEALGPELTAWGKRMTTGVGARFDCFGPPDAPPPGVSKPADRPKR